MMLHVNQHTGLLIYETVSFGVSVARNCFPHRILLVNIGLVICVTDCRLLFTGIWIVEVKILLSNPVDSWSWFDMLAEIWLAPHPVLLAIYNCICCKATTVPDKCTPPHCTNPWLLILIQIFGNFSKLLFCNHLFPTPMTCLFALFHMHSIIRRDVQRLAHWPSYSRLTFVNPVWYCVPLFLFYFYIV
jgi:hypothetical protein